MPKVSGGISGLSVAMIAAGGLLIVSGIKDAPVLDALRDIMQGRAPQGRAQTSKMAGRAVGDAIGKAAKRAGKMTRLAGNIGDGFGAARSGGRKHKGIDIAAPTGTPIPAAANGKVTNTGYEPGGAGNFLVIDHGGGLLTKYFHLSRFASRRSDVVTEGQTIGFVGSTGNSSGPHLHFEVWEGGQARDPMGYV